MLKTFLKSAVLIFLTVPAMAMQSYHPGEQAEMASNVVPPALQGVGVTQRLNKKLNLNLQFTDSDGKVYKLSHFFDKGHPVVMAMVYYRCKNLCGMQLMGLAKTFSGMSGKAGKFYSLVLVSMDPTETPQIAAAKKAKVMPELGKPQADKHWHFMVGDKANVHELAKEFGFRYKWDAQLKEFAHPTATYIVTPSGKISRYLFGVDFPPKTMRLSLVQAGEGDIGTLADDLALCCFRFSPHGNKYVLWSFNIMRIACVFTVIILLIVLLPVWIKEKKRRRAEKLSVPSGS